MNILNLERLLTGGLLAIAILSFFPVLWHFYMMWKNMKKEYKYLSGFLGAFFIFFPKLFTEKGNYHRIRHGFFLMVFLLLLGLLLLIAKKSQV